MRKFIVAMCICLSVPTAAADTPEQATRRMEAPNALAARLDVEFTSATTEAIQVVGQAVLKKALRAGWAELARKLASLAGCSRKPPLMTKTCDTLNHARIEDLVASPRVLLDAFVGDLMAIVRTRIDALPLSSKAALGGLIGAWVALGPDAVKLHVKPWLKEKLREYSTGVACPANKAADVGWVVAQCYVASTATPAVEGLGQCKVTEWVDKCAEGNRADVLRVSELVIAMVDAIGNNRSPTELAIKAFFEWAKLADEAYKATLDELETIFLGLYKRDWTRVVVGIGHLAAEVNTQACKEDKCECTIGMKLVRIVAAIGQFAETNKGDSAAREKVIEDLVTSLVDRSERDHGAVLSLGGTAALFGGARVVDDDGHFAVPVRLTLGLGLQSYHSKVGGLHASIDALDLSQYVTYKQGALEVSEPDLKSAVVVGATVGYWFKNRETPIFIGVHGSVSPFVRGMDNRATYEIGGILGVYVPLLDFN